MSTVDNVDTAGMDTAADTEDRLTGLEEENIDLPDDFFDEFEDSKFVDEIVEIVAPEQMRLIRKEDVNDTVPDANNQSNDATGASQSNHDHDTKDFVTKRCIEEINSLTKSIERRRRRLQNGISEHNKRTNRVSHSPSTSRTDRNVRSRDRRMSPRRSPSGSRGRRRSRSRDRSRSRSRERSRRDRRSSRSRRDRSRSASPLNQSRPMTFLEELAQKFAEKGLDFPEKQLLIDRKNGTPAINPYPATGNYSRCEAPYMQMPNTQMPMYNANQLYQPQWNGNYMTSNMQHVPLPLPAVNDTMTNLHSAIVPVDRTTTQTSKAAVVARCRAASKILRSEENRVPKLRFLFTRTSMPVEDGQETTPQLQSRKNVEFEQTSHDRKPLAPLQFLPIRTRELVKILGYNCGSILNRLRLKDFADKVLHEIEDIHAEKKRTKECTYTDSEMQTESYKCPGCLNREAITFLNKSMQTETPKKVNIRTQTNEKDYREPIIRSLSRITAGQLVAVSDFIDLICEPRPSTSTELYSVREKLMDIYNLSARGSEAIEAERASESRRRGINNSSMPSPPLEDLRATIRGTSDQNMRIPPPPPLLTYQINPEEEERAMRFQQMQFDEELRRINFEAQQNTRQMEWDRQQRIQQQRQLQLQREQEEENSRMEMRNERFGRGNNYWDGARGRY